MPDYSTRSRASTRITDRVFCAELAHRDGATVEAGHVGPSPLGWLVLVAQTASEDDCGPPPSGLQPVSPVLQS